MTTEEKIDKALELLFGMKPVLDSVHSGQEAIEERVRAVEIQGSNHGVVISRIQSDMDGLGRKVRGIEGRVAVPRAAAGAPQEPIRWLAAAMEFIGALPAYWHIGLAAVGGASAVAAVLLRHR